MPLYPSITYLDENDIPEDVTRATNLHIHVHDGKCLMKIKPIEGLVIHLNTNVNISEFISDLTYSWVKTIKYLRIWLDGKYCCTIYEDKCTKKFKSISKISDKKIMMDYYSKITDDSTKPIYFSDLPHEMKHLENINKMLIVDNRFLHGIGVSKSLCYRHCIVSVLWLIYFIASKHDRIIVDDRVEYGSMGSLTSIHSYVLRSIRQGHMRYLKDDEMKYIDNVYNICHSIDVLYYGRECKAHP